MGGAQPKERRKRARASLSLPVRLGVERVGAVTSLFSTDIGEGGVYVETGLRLPVGTEVSLQIYLGYPTGRMQAKGRVVRTDPRRGQDPGTPSGLAIQFTEHGEAGWEFLQNLIRASSQPSAE